MPPKFSREYASASREAERQSLLEGGSEEEDFFLHGPSARPQKLVQKDGKISRVQGQVDQVIEVMQDNIGKVLDRGERLEDLQDKSENLSSNSDLFRVRAQGLKNSMWWKECKLRILFGLVVIIILIIIIVPIIVKYKKN